MKHYPFILFYIIGNLIIYGFQGGFWVYFGLFIIFLLVVINGVSDIQFDYFLKSINKKRTRQKEVALTFDDGPTEFTPQFLDILKENNIKATFFCIGKQIEKHPEIFRRIIDEGHCVGNHSYTHSNSIGWKSTSEMILEIENADQEIEKFGINISLYRPPFGITNPNIARAIKKTNKISIGWNIRSFDTSTNDEKKILQRITKNINKGSIVLMHDTSQKTYNVLVDLLLFLQNKKYTTFTLDDITKKNL